MLHSSQNWVRWALMLSTVSIASIAALGVVSLRAQSGVPGAGSPAPWSNADSDGDTVPDREDSDDDNDGLTDVFEEDLGTSPVRPDSDGDTLPDSAEVFGCETIDPATGLPRWEFTDPNNDDGDGDGYTDGYEKEKGSDPNDREDYPGSDRADGRPPSHQP